MAFKAAVAPNACSPIAEDLESSSGALEGYRYRCLFLCVQVLRVHADWLFLFSFTVTLITARNMCRGWHSALLAAWAPQKCAETLQERWKSSSKLPTPILGRRYFGKLLDTLLQIKTQD